MTLQNIGDCAAGDLVAEIRQRTLSPAIAPILVLLCHANDQRFDLTTRARPSWSATGAPIVLLGNQSPVLGEQGFRLHDGGYFRQEFPAEPLGSSCLAADAEITSNT